MVGGEPGRGKSGRDQKGVAQTRRGCVAARRSGAWIIDAVPGKKKEEDVDIASC